MAPLLQATKLGKMLSEACDKGIWEQARILLQCGADPNWKSEAGTTPLHWAAMKTGGAGTVQLLIAHHADVNAENKIGRTPLKMATLLSNQTEQISILKANGGALSAMEVSSAATATAKAIEVRLEGTH